MLNTILLAMTILGLIGLLAWFAWDVAHFDDDSSTHH